MAFLDRDGVINKDIGYLHRIEDFEFTEGCIEALSKLRCDGFEVIIVTNQSGIGRGYYTEADYQSLTKWYLNELTRAGVNVLDVFHCPHTPDDQCSCRKPKPGLFQQAIRKYPNIDLKQSLMIGDKVTDIEAAKAVGIRKNYLISSKSIENNNPLAYPNLFSCVEAINQT